MTGRVPRVVAVDRSRQNRNSAVTLAHPQGSPALPTLALTRVDCATSPGKFSSQTGACVRGGSWVPALSLSYTAKNAPPALALGAVGSGGRIRTADLRVMRTTTAFAARRTGL